MRREFWFWLALLGCGLTCLLAAPAADSPADAAGCCEGGKKAVGAALGACDTKVCPLYCWGFFGSYCAYYAKRCSPVEYVGLNSNCGLSGNDCGNASGNCNGCVDGGSFMKLTAGRKHHYHDPSL